VSPEQEGDLLDALQRKARSDVEALIAGSGASSASRQMLLTLLDLNGGLEVLERARTVFKQAPAVVAAAIDNLETVARRVQQETPDADLHVDLAELGGYHYYTGTLFAAFVPGRGSALAKGGRYDGIGKAFGRNRAATGFGADLRELLKVANPSAPAARGILAPAGDDSELTRTIARLRADGERVVRQLPGDAAAAADLGCDRVLRRKAGHWIVEAADA